MASFFEQLNEGLGNVTSTPMGQLGMGLLMASGQQQGNPGFGDRLGQAFGGMAQMQQTQALQEYRRQMIAQQAQEMAMRQQAAQAKAEQAQQYQQRLQDPTFLAGLGPLAQAFARMGVDPGELIRAQNADNLQAHRAASLAQQQGQFDQRQARGGAGGGGSSGPRMPTQRQVLDEPLGDGMMQRHVLNPQSGQYEPYGQPFPQYSPGRGKGKSADPLAGLVDQLTPAAAGPGLESLPGTGSLQSYAPPQGAALLMQGAPKITSSGSVPKASSAAPAQAKPATPRTKAEYDALPAGAQYIDPATGKTATKRAR